MSLPIKKSVDSPTRAGLRRNDIIAGTGNEDYGPTANTDYYNNLNIPDNGYIVSIIGLNSEIISFSAKTTEELILINRHLGGIGTTLAQAKEELSARNETWIMGTPLDNIYTSDLKMCFAAGDLSSYAGSGTLVHDLSGEGVEGTLINGVGFDSNGYFDFDAVGDYINIETPTTNSIYTISMLYKTGPNDNTAGYFSSDDTTDSKGLAASQGITFGGLVYGQFYYYDGEDLINLTQTTLLTPNTNFNISAIIDNTENNIKVYINGELSADQSMATDAMSPSVVEIGRFNRSARNYLNGKLADYRIYNKELSQEEVNQNHYQSPIVTDGLIYSSDAGNLVSYESPSTSVASLTGSIDGTLENGVGFDSNNGGVWNFDGVDDYIEITPNGFGKFNKQEFTIGLWCYIDADESFRPLLWDFPRPTTPPNLRYAQQIRISTVTSATPNYNNLMFRYNSTSQREILISDVGVNAIDLDQWNYLTVSYKSGRQRIYINGKISLSGSTTGTISYENAPVWTGQANHMNSDFEGKSTKYTFYDRELTEAEVMQNYSSDVAKMPII